MELLAQLVLAILISGVVMAIVLILTIFLKQTAKIDKMVKSQQRMEGLMGTPLKRKGVHKSDSQPMLATVKSTNPKEQQRIIVLTGGPCAGKTTALAYISEKCSEKGIKTYIVPEAATLLCKGGFSLDNSAKQPNQVLKFQINLMKIQISLEDIFTEIASMEKVPTLILCDRGVMDGKAYMSKDEWQALLDETGWNTVQLRDKRYDAVLHLVTAADGASSFYNLNNIARTETVDQAIALDKKTMGCWMAHPGFCCVDNNFPSFKEKIDKTLECVLRQFGVPLSNQFYKKYLLMRNVTSDVVQIPDTYKPEQIEIEDFYINHTSENIIEEKVRRRGQKDSCTYQYRVKYSDKGQIIESRRSITAREYMKYCQPRNLIKGRAKLSKIRQCFLWKNLYFKIDTYTNIDHKPSILIVQIEPNAEELATPPFIQILREITDEATYSISKMLDNGWKMEEKDILALEGKKRINSECIETKLKSD
jgi:hypothetical protein